jgi:hypothetical protein
MAIRTLEAHSRRALRPNGRLVIVEPITDRLRDESRAVQVNAHELAPEHVVGELHAAGFRVERLDSAFSSKSRDQRNELDHRRRAERAGACRPKGSGHFVASGAATGAARRH